MSFASCSIERSARSCGTELAANAGRGVNATAPMATIADQQRKLDPLSDIGR